MKKQTGMFWHVHHDKLLEYCYTYDERMAFIKKYKPEYEIDERLRLFKPVKGKLPDEVSKASAARSKASAAYCKAYDVLDKASAAYRKASAVLDKAYAAFDKASAAFDKASAAYRKAYAACSKAPAAFDKASAAFDKVLTDNMPILLKLHAKECGCGWTKETGIKFS
jgi:hypothetical protein